MYNQLYSWQQPGADPGFQVRGGTLKKIAPSGGRCEIFLGISCEKSQFYVKKSYLFQFRGGAHVGFTPPPPVDPPLATIQWNISVDIKINKLCKKGGGEWDKDSWYILVKRRNCLEEIERGKGVEIFVINQSYFYFSKTLVPQYYCTICKNIWNLNDYHKKALPVTHSWSRYYYSPLISDASTGKEILVSWKKAKKNALVDIVKLLLSRWKSYAKKKGDPHSLQQIPFLI
jgi:hypothetical protein